MLGNPKFREDQLVEFQMDNRVVRGKIYIIDPYGTFFQTEEVSYDVMVDGTPYNCLYKHIRESCLKAVEE